MSTTDQQIKTDYIIHQLDKVDYTNEYGRSIVLKASGGEHQTFNLSITDKQYNQIRNILLKG